jgi:hypothetical protein
MAPALLAAALAVGTKTTTLPLAGIVLVAAGVAGRAHLRRHARGLAIAALAAFVVGGFWYARNLVLHGSPFWPFVATPWGDPVPEVIAPSGQVVEQVYTKFFDTPWATVEFVASRWADPFLGGLVLIGFALPAPLVAPRRPVVAAAGVTLLSLLLWMNAPFTGVSEGDAGSGALTTMRYLVPTFAAAATTLALAAREGSRGRVFALAGLGAGLAATTWQLLGLGYPAVPQPGTLVAGAVVGALLFSAMALVAPRVPSVRIPAPAITVLAAALVGALLSLGGSSFVDRYATATDPLSTISATPQLVRWFQSRPGYEEGDRPIAFNVVMNASVAGNEVQHRIDLIDAHEGCARQRQRVKEGYVVVNSSWPTRSCLRGLPVRYRRGEYTVYGG